MSSCFLFGRFCSPQSLAASSAPEPMETEGEAPAEESAPADAEPVAAPAEEVPEKEKEEAPAAAE